MRYPPGMIGLACGEISRFSDFIPSLIGLAKPPGTVFMKGTGLGPANPFNGIARAFLSHSPRLDWLFLTNDDHVYPQDALYRLLDRNVDVVSGLYFGRIQPFEPILFDSVTPKGNHLLYNRHLMAPDDSGLVQAAGVGDGCLLIRRNVLEAIDDPWWEYGGALTDACNHDLNFSRKVIQAGFGLYCDLDVRVDHIAAFAVRPVRLPDGRWEVHLVQGSPNEAGGVRSISLPAASLPVRREE